MLLQKKIREIVVRDASKHNMFRIQQMSDNYILQLIDIYEF